MSPKNDIPNVDFHNLFVYKQGNLYRKKQVSNKAAGGIAGWNHKQGYIMVTVNKRKYLAHRVIWFMHYGKWPKDQINHINGIKSDNRIENLEEVTNLENRNHAVKMNLHYKGEKINSKLTSEKVLKIRQELKNGKKQKDLAIEYKVSKGTIQQVSYGKIWKHV